MIEEIGSDVLSLIPELGYSFEYGLGYVFVLSLCMAFSLGFSFSVFSFLFLIVKSVIKWFQHRKGDEIK